MILVLVYGFFGSLVGFLAGGGFGSLSPSELGSDLLAVLGSDRAFYRVGLVGEVLNVRSVRGHQYFSVTDGRFCVACVFFRGKNRASFCIENGQRVFVRGRLGLHPSKSVFQLFVDSVEVQGCGGLSESLRRLYAGLLAEGLFDSALKKPLPSVVRRVGLLVAEGSDAERDVVAVLTREASGVSVFRRGVLLSGAGAVSSVLSGLSDLVRDGVDVIVVARGGGPQEDLALFNDERVVRAFASCSVPVVTGIGHASDSTLSDLAADVCAFTPTDAALVVCRGGAGVSGGVGLDRSWSWFLEFVFGVGSVLVGLLVLFLVLFFLR